MPYVTWKNLVASHSDWADFHSASSGLVEDDGAAGHQIFRAGMPG
jgi:hypothetical protein